MLDTSICDPGNPDLVACFGFDKGTTLDGSQYGNDLLPFGVSYVEGASGLAVQTTAASTLRTSNHSSLRSDSFTLEAWIRPSQSPSMMDGKRAAIIANPGRYGLFLYPNDRIHCSSGGSVSAYAALPANEWTHLACTLEGETLTLWINGWRGPSAQVSGPPGMRDNGQLTIAGSVDGDELTGAIDNVRVFRTARSASEIADAAGLR